MNLDSDRISSGNEEAGVLTPPIEKHAEECLNFVWTQMFILVFLPQRKELNQNQRAATPAHTLEPSSILPTKLASFHDLKTALISQ